MEHVKLELGDENATGRLGLAIAAVLRRHVVASPASGNWVLLEGELGAGKTSLAGAVARALGVPEDLPVTSPTFSLAHEYTEANPPLIHADLYRIQPGEELELLALPPADGWVALIEWGREFIPDLGEPCLSIRLVITGEKQRRAEVSGPLAEQLQAAFR